MLNRAGDTIFWSSVNENLINFLKCFTESFFFQKILLNMVFSKLLYSLFYINRGFFFQKMRNCDGFSDLYSKEYRMSFNYRYLLAFLATVEKKKYYFSKIFFFCFNGWVVVSIRLYNVLNHNKIKKNFSYDILFLWKYFLITHSFKKNIIFNNKKYF